MNKADLIASVATKANLTKKDSESAVNAFVATVTESLKKGDKISLVGFGTFEVRARAAREGINPQTKKAIKIPAKTVASFKAGSKLKDALN